ncbi:coiled-coil domain-containing protein 174 isoform X1 [Dendroctonus ponderosae]|uniref:coiled-coil domain-containing protein 174 isoform X1 n=1 Tax=Dendroctonus ponderosae TaxID=77166 RepID=UPI002034C03B|nr:coiled-coil domain-containing protein 174 isoform X1 [Dendroctonus ponderosae]
MSTYEISKSSLLSLKAEILRKQEDVARAKIENDGKIRTIKKKYTVKKNKGIENREINDLTEEDHDLLRLSKSRLEAKTKLYDKLSKGSSTNEENDRLYLVRFGAKGMLASDQGPVPPNDLPDDLPPVEEEEAYSDFEDDNVNPEDDWVEYTDSLGRSRKCLRRDLAEFKSRDADLREIAEKRQQIAPSRDEEKRDELETASNNERQDKEVCEKDPIDEESEMISGDMRRHMLRQQWEKEEEALRDKSDIHYQNVLFNEARQHGVGYYAFSKDEEERAQQQAALNKLRVETEKEQKRAKDLKTIREQQLAARMKAARNRKRARMGLPPEEDVESNAPPEEPTETPEDIEKQNKKAEEERRLNAARKRHVRPWDIGKDGVRPEFYEMTQHEWNDKKRKERPTEFAPPTAYSAREFNSMRSLDTDIHSSNKSLKFSSMDSKRKLQNLNPYKKTIIHETELEKPNNPEESSSIQDDDDDDNSERNDRLLGDYMQSRPRLYSPEYPTSDAEQHSGKMQPVPIVNELETDVYETEKPRLMPSKAVPVKKGVEIPPPLTFEHFGPSDRPFSHSSARNSSGPVNIAASIEAGLKFLRNQTEGTKRSKNGNT